MYTDRLAARREALARMERQHARIAMVRLALGLAGVALLIALGLAPWKTLASLVVLFAVIAVGHGRLINARDRARSAVDFYERGIARLEHRWMGQGDAGDRFLPTQHLYAADLDLFGHGSLFELLATCRTEGGRATLARWLLAPAAPDEIRARQEAVRELMPDLDVREHLSVEGDQMRPGVDASHLATWARATRLMPGPIAEVAVRAAPILLVAATIGTTQGAPGMLVLGAALLAGMVALALRAKVLQVTEAVQRASRDLDVIVGVARVLEGRTDSAARLVDLRTRLAGDRGSASAAIGTLAQLVALLSSRSNVIFAPVAALLMWTTQMAFSIERWRTRHGHQVPQWLEAVAEFDALSALAGYAAEHPAYVFAELAAPPAHLRTTDLAHPLLPATAVANGISLGQAAPSLLIVSGSNMSGKSTFLRALGVNVVLAQMGAPVRASSFRLAPLAVGASIRVLDSLQEGHSRFYAEILRLKHIVDLARAHAGATLFLLDEVLGGTNSHDRRQGAEGLLRGLTGLGAIGLATTHDLALGEIADGWSPQAANVHFADAFDGGSLAFDYVLRQGPVRTSNALALMRSIGLDVDTV
ncbi:MAG: DNA mismatch repair protein MutS [Acidobacteria bacterium]|nr:DNA mismatch repair protein MutS [Acidobacteriota bacterium]